MTTTIEPAAIADPVVVDGLSTDEYHADRASISSTGLRKLLAPGCPAQFKYDRDNPQPHKKEFDLGHAAHLLVLGEGPELAVIDYPDWRKKDAQSERDDAYAEGKVPLLTKDFEVVTAMAAAIRQHPLAGPLFAPGSGVAERSIFWTDPATGIRCRVRPDYLKQLPGLTLAVDYKTITKADPETISKAIRDHGYHQQDALYVDGIEAAGLAPDGCRFLFVFQQKTAPYLITVRELAGQDRDIGRAKNERALRIYADCTTTGIWPDWTGPVEDIPVISMPTWAVLNETEEYLK
ncbi:PD-(D/E)XK nuclease-like domain-containing protein [Streptomyces sp. NBC_01498]|uniref:PD-(D/E)XK nuclease-like domain-containing protein n=1 Tax=Streptomyces sp. NBC_01498 TaxID=2975870 RepID=UPI002E7AF946|nr:PD-(D/E)XK nuclease-like domain-containing protein [Streptomyces sp. NBC_01498]WTL24060.1 PD-(D/E)XK nuclease-like domain-containing protein [Streptomyces sp. NBC_01498]